MVGDRICGTPMRKPTLRSQLESSKREAEWLKYQLRSAEQELTKILRRRKFTYGQRRALKALLVMLHVKTLFDQITETTHKFLMPLIAENLRAESPFVKLLRQSGLARFNGGTKIKNPVRK
jgi:hypothetical protein